MKHTLILAIAVFGFILTPKAQTKITSQKIAPKEHKAITRSIVHEKRHEKATHGHRGEKIKKVELKTNGHTISSKGNNSSKYSLHSSPNSNRRLKEKIEKK